MVCLNHRLDGEGNGWRRYPAAVLTRKGGPTMSQELSPNEQRVRAFLVSKARQADPNRPGGAKIEYQQLAKAIDPQEDYWAWPRFRGLGDVLGNVSVFEHEHDRPLISALVVQAGTHQAGNGF